MVLPVDNSAVAVSEEYYKLKENKNMKVINNNLFIAHLLRAQSDASGLATAVEKWF